MEEKQTLEDIRDSYAKRVEELKAQQVEIKIELEHCIRMKEAYDYIIKMKVYYDESISVVRGHWENVEGARHTIKCSNCGHIRELKHFNEIINRPKVCEMCGGGMYE